MEASSRKILVTVGKLSILRTEAPQVMPKLESRLL